MKKVILMILSLAMMFSGAIAVPVSAEEKAIPASGYTFMDIAYNGNGTYVAMAKQNKKYTHLYYSIDGGITWSRSTNLGTSDSNDFTYVNTISTNPDSQQQLVYWPEKNVFLAHSPKVTLVSSDGITWTPNPNIFWKADTLMTVSGKHLILAGGSGKETSMNATDDLNTKKFVDNKLTISSSASYYSKVVAAKPVDNEGNIQVYVDGNMIPYDFKLNNETGKFDSTSVVSNSGNTVMSPYDMIYASGADQFLSVDGSENIIAAKDSQHVSKYTVKEGVNVTGVNANDSYIVVGMSDGTMYYTANAEITADTVWTEIPAQSGTTACSEPIKNIEFSGSNTFIALSATQAYKCNTTQYCNVNEYFEENFEIGTPEVSVKNSMLEGVRLIGGTYSPTLNKYIVYGDTTAPDENNKYWGKIFTSSNGIDWEQTYIGYTFTQRTDSGGTNEVRNGAVWWESQGRFIVSASTLDHSGVSLVSTDGMNWKAILMKDNKDADGNLVPELDTDFRLNTDIVVSGDKLYTTNNGRQFRTYTAWNKDSMTYIGVTEAVNSNGVKAIVPQAWAMNQICVSDETNPAVLMYQNANGVVYDNTTSTWYQSTSLTSAGSITDSVYSSKLGKFIAVSTSGDRTSIISKDGTKETGPIVTGGVVCSAVDTNGTNFMFAGKDGNVYTALDTADFSKANTTLTKVPAVSGNDNTMSLTNVFKTSGNKFIATATNNTDSDILVIDKNTEGEYGYVSINEASGGEALERGQRLNIKVNVVNQRTAEYNFDMITAVYSSNGVLVQVQKNSESVPERTTTDVSETMVLDDNVPDGAELKVFIWDSANGMKSEKPVTIPF